MGNNLGRVFMDKNNKKSAGQAAKERSASSKEIEKEMQDAVDAAFLNRDPKVQERLRAMFPNGEPTVEEFIRVIASKMNGRES